MANCWIIMHRVFLCSLWNPMKSWHMTMKCLVLSFVCNMCVWAHPWMCRTNLHMTEERVCQGGKVEHPMVSNLMSPFFGPIIWPILTNFVLHYHNPWRGNHNPSDILINIDWDFLVGMLINVWNIDDYMGLYKSMQIILGTIMDYQNLWRGNAVLNQAVFPGRHRVSNTAQSDIFLGNTETEEDLNPSFWGWTWTQVTRSSIFFTLPLGPAKNIQQFEKKYGYPLLLPMFESVDFESMMVSCIKIIFKSMLRRSQTPDSMVLWPYVLRSNVGLYVYP